MCVQVDTTSIGFLNTLKPFCLGFAALTPTGGVTTNPYLECVFYKMPQVHHCHIQILTAQISKHDLHITDNIKWVLTRFFVAVFSHQQGVQLLKATWGLVARSDTCNEANKTIFAETLVRATTGIFEGTVSQREAQYIIITQY